MEQQQIPCTILIKRRVSGDPGPPNSLSHGELAFNEANDNLYIGSTNNEPLSGS